MNTCDYELTTYEGEYPNLMMLISDKLIIEDFGECKGIGRCGTCHIYIVNPGQTMLIKEGNENNTLNKLDDRNENSRLACQILINESINGIYIHVVS